MRFIGLRRFGGDKERVKQCSLPKYSSIKVGVDKLKEYSNELIGAEKVYITQSAYRMGVWGTKEAYSCTKNNLHSISSLFIDVDTYRKGSLLETLTPKEAMPVLKKILEQAGIPLPLFINSGCGLYLIWALGERLNLGDKALASRWEAVQGRIVQFLEPYGADMKVRDLTRILRLIGTVNEKNGALVEPLYDDGKYHSLERLEAATSHLKSVSKKKKKKPSGKKESKTALVTTSVQQEKGRALGNTETKALRTSLDAADNSWTIEQDDLDRFNQFAHVMRTEFSKKKITDHRSLTYRYFRLFEDLAALVNLRKGTKNGYRNDFVFWSLALLHNARLINTQNLHAASDELRYACQDRFDDFDVIHLSSLQQRMEEDELTHKGEVYTVNKIKKAKPRPKPLTWHERGGFRLLNVDRINTSARDRAATNLNLMSRDHQEKSFKGHGRKSYTPSVRIWH